MQSGLDSSLGYRKKLILAILFSSVGENDAIRCCYSTKCRRFDWFRQQFLLEKSHAFLVAFFFFYKFFIVNETPWSESVSGRFKQQPKAFRHKPDAIRYHSIEKSELARLIALLDYFLWWSSNQVVSAESSCQSLERWIYIEWTHSRLQVNVLLITFWRGMAE